MNYTRVFAKEAPVTAQAGLGLPMLGLERDKAKQRCQVRTAHVGRRSFLGLLNVLGEEPDLKTAR